ncbi:GGDEF domain-containing protein [Pseudoalteromonas phenolica]|uniref:GGDEF domain-containing protein n=1 Tax=Pseudoalteromonas phenolica TaxID=161398 RepID=UPI00110B37D4|nr:GGDEF domain-containing protein [Pseudoalteromonas phenolica]TMO56033.1 GGDEF domain-containing protein [Pseudoalteromonas phenolica]
MKSRYFYIFILTVTLCLAVLLLNRPDIDLDAFEELFWFTCTGLLIGYGAQYVSNRFLILAWGMYCVGLFLDVLDDILTKDTLPILVADTSLKKIGLILTCIVLYNVIHHERKIINKLNSEINRRKKLEDRLNFEANHDHLTQLGNRKSCFENFATLSSKYPYLLYFDLDNFKHANDKYGHQTGDEVLISISNALQTEFGADNCFRLGGDEFVAFSQVPPENIDTLRNRLVEQIFEFDVGVSIGIAKITPNESPDEIMHRADSNMYSDKSHKIIRQTPRT